MRNTEVIGFGKNLSASGVYVCVFASANEWSSFIKLSVSIYDPLICNKCRTFPPVVRINTGGRKKEKGKGV